MSILKTTTFVLVLMITAAFAQQHDGGKGKQPPLSPPAHTETTISGKKVSIDYSAPSMRGRKIMGELVPFGQVWRTGANSATTLKTETDLLIGGQKVPAGTYTIYSLPGENDWKLIINKQTGQWGTVYDEKQDLARIDLKTEPLTSPVEDFTIAFDPQGGNDCRMRLDWEKTRAYADIKEKQ